MAQRAAELLCRDHCVDAGGQPGGAPGADRAPPRPDGRIAVVAANSILERAFGKVREARPEDLPKAAIDLSSLSDAEPAILMKLVESSRPRPTSSDLPGAGAVIAAARADG